MHTSQERERERAQIMSPEEEGGEAHAKQLAKRNIIKSN